MSRRRWILTATVLGSAMAFIDGSVVNVALPVLQASLGATLTHSQWIVDAYLLVLSSLLLAGGALGDHFGRIRVFAAGVAIFAAASVWCGAAPDAAQLIAARALQGLGGALLVPGSLAIIAATFPPNERGRAIGTWSALTSLGVIAGPLLGGWLVQTVSWRAVFYINVPIAAVTLLIVWHVRSAEEVPRNREPQPIDWTGTLLITMALGALTFALIEWPSHHGALPSAALVISPIAFAAFIIRERRAANPIVPLAMFRSRDFAAANVLTLLLYSAVSAVTFLLPFDLIQAQGYSPAEAGAAFLPFVVTMSLLSRWTGALADRVGPRLPLIVGPLVVAAGFSLLAFRAGAGSYWTAFFPGILTIGVGMATTVAPLTTTVMTSLDDEAHVGAASGINNTVARAAGLLAIALFGSLSIMLFSRQLEGRLIRENPAIRESVLAERGKLAAAQPPPGVDDETRRRVRKTVDEAFRSVFRTDMFAAAGTAAASAAAALAIRRRGRKPA